MFVGSKGKSVRNVSSHFYSILDAVFNLNILLSIQPPLAPSMLFFLIDFPKLYFFLSTFLLPVHYIHVPSMWLLSFSLLHDHARHCKNSTMLYFPVFSTV